MAANINKGFIYLHRSLIEDIHYFECSFDRIRCWIDLLLLAEWKDGRTVLLHKKSSPITLKRGQIALSVTELSKRWQLARNTVAARLSEFEADERITTERTSHGTVITIVNYDKYQVAFAAQRNGIEQQIEQQKSQQIEQQKSQTKSYNSSSCETKAKNIEQQIEQQKSLSVEQLPNNKNNINIITQHYARTHESSSSLDEYAEMLKNDTYYCELTAMQFHFGSVEAVKSIIEQFKRHCELGDEAHNDIGDFKRHFRDWCKYQIKNNNETSRNQNINNNQRRGTEVEATSASSYEGKF